MRVVRKGKVIYFNIYSFSTHLIELFITAYQRFFTSFRMTGGEGLRLALERRDDMHYKTNVQANSL